MNNHFNHISATEKLKAETLKKAKRINFTVISSIAAIFVVLIGVSAFYVSGIANNQEPNYAPELYNDSINSESFVSSDTIADDANEKYESFYYAQLSPTPKITLLLPTATPVINTTNTTVITPTATPVINTTNTTVITPSAPPVLTTKAPSPTLTPMPTTAPQGDGLTAQVTERPANYDETIAANRETMYITADNVAAHDRASTDAPVKFTIPKGAQVIADRNFKRIWAYVHYEEDGIKKYGFVLEEYLSTEKP